MIAYQLFFLLCSDNDVKMSCKQPLSISVVGQPSLNREPAIIGRRVHANVLFEQNISNTILLLRPTFAKMNAHRLHDNICTATSNARFWVWVHILVNLVAMAFLFTMFTILCLPWVLNFNLSQARLLKETACNYVFSALVHGIPSIIIASFLSRSTLT